MSWLEKLGFSPSEIPQEDGEKIEPVETVTEASFHFDEVIDMARKSLDFLAGLAMPTIYKFSYPPVFLAVWAWLLSFSFKPRDFSQLALGLPRGFGKTTLIKLYVVFCILFTQKKFILVISSTATLAENFLSDVVDMLDEPNIKKVFGDWRLGIEKDTQSIKKFGFRGRNIILAGLGAGTSLRGLNLKNERPDVMIFEDIQTRECADSAVQSDTLERWMIGTAMKAKSPLGCLFIFVANMYPTKHSLLRKLKHNSAWTKFIAGGILADGTSLWEELQPVSQLTAEFQNDLEMGHPEIFYAEVLNDENASSNNLIDLSKLPALPYSEGDIPQGKFIIIDPSGQKLGSDRTAIGYFEVYDSHPVLVSLVNKVLSPGDTIVEALRLALTNNCRLIAIESVAYQASLCYWFKFICEQRGIYGIEAVEVYPGGYSKNSRILNMFKELISGETYIAKDCRAEVFLQITQWNPLKKDNVDDLLDLLSYPRKVVEMYGEFIVCDYQVISQEGDAIELLPAEVTSAFYGVVMAESFLNKMLGVRGTDVRPSKLRSQMERAATLNARPESDNLDTASKALDLVSLIPGPAAGAGLFAALAKLQQKITAPGKAALSKLSDEAVTKSATDAALAQVDPQTRRIMNIVGEGNTVPYVYTLPASDPQRRAYQLLVENSNNRVDDRQFFEGMADILAETGKIPAAEAKQLKNLNTKFGSEGSWAYIRDRMSENNPAIYNIIKDAGVNLKGTPEAADIAILSKEGKRASAATRKELNKQADIINNVKNNIADLLEPVAREHSKQFGAGDLGGRARAEMAGFDLDNVWARVDSAFSPHANPNYLDPTSVANQAKTTLQEDLKGSAARYHGQFFTDLSKPNASGELGKYAGPRNLPTVFSPVSINRNTLANTYDATSQADFLQVQDAFRGSGILDDDTADILTQRLDDLVAKEGRPGSQAYTEIEERDIMTLLKNAGFKGFYTDEPGYLKGNISVFDPSAVRDTRAVFDPTLSWSGNRFAGIGAGSIGSTPVVEYLTRQEDK